MLIYNISMVGEMIKRREFFICAGVAAGAVRAWGQSADPAKMDRVAIMSYSFNLIVKSDAHPNDPVRTLDILDFPESMAQRYGIHNLEIQHYHFRSTEPDYLDEFRSRLKKAQSRVSQIVLEFGALNVSSADAVVRVETIDLTKRWIDLAVTLGCPRVMVNQGALAPEQRLTAIDSLKKMNAYAKTKNVLITMENRDDPAAAGVPARPHQHTWDVEVEVMKAAGILANPDISSFPDNAAREAGLRAMYAMAGSSHFKYMPELFDSAKAIQISKEVGYKGLFSIEAEPLTREPYPFVETILGELLRDL
jgi:hypothetical protein